MDLALGLRWFGFRIRGLVLEYNVLTPIEVYIELGLGLVFGLGFRVYHIVN